MDKYTELARKTIEEYISNKKTIKTPVGLPGEFYSRRAGAFVTIFKNDDLRGCIGTFMPVRENIAKEIIENAISACSKDYRFSPIKKSDLRDLRYEVSILSAPQLVGDIKKHDPKKYGLIVRCLDGRSGLLLPDLEGVDTVDEQFRICCQKGGINPKKDDFELYSFMVEKHI